MSLQYVSKDRFQALQAELRQLKTVTRRAVAERLETAKALGDLSENAEYHDAKDEMIALEMRIYELEEFLKTVHVIEADGSADGVVRIGSSVVVSVNGKDKKFEIVGSNEADPLQGKISNESPIGSALLGANIGARISVQTPAGLTVYTIKKVS